MNKIQYIIALVLSLGASVVLPTTTYAQEAPTDEGSPQENSDGVSEALDRFESRLRELATEENAPEVIARLDDVPTDTVVDEDRFRALIREYTVRSLLASTSAATVGEDNVVPIQQTLQRAAAAHGDRLVRALTRLHAQHGDACYEQARTLIEDAADPDVEVSSLGQQVIALSEALRSEDDPDTSERVLLEGVRLLRNASGR